MKERVIVLNGPSSSGKSTLASILQTHLMDVKKEAYEIVSIDDFLKMTTKDTIYEDDVFEVSSQLCRKALEYVHNGVGVIIDHVITSERIYKEIIESLKEAEVHMVHVTCPLEELEKREASRRNRCIGSAEASYQYLYPKDGYDITVNTYELTMEECAKKIIDIL